LEFHATFPHVRHLLRSLLLAGDRYRGQRIPPRRALAWWALLVGNTLTYLGATAYDQMYRACIGARIRRPNPVMNVYSSSARNPRMHTGRWRTGATPCPAALRASAHLTHSF
jgi:hypothetical protein